MLFFKRTKPKDESSASQDDPVAPQMERPHRNDSLRTLMHISEPAGIPLTTPLPPPAPSEPASAGLKRTVLDTSNHQISAAPTPLEPVQPTSTLTPPPALSTTPETNPTHSEREVSSMSNIRETIQTALSDIDGASAAALVDYNSGMMLGSGGSGVNLELAAAGNTDVVKAKMRTMKSLGISGGIEDILITLDSQYHIIYLVPGQTLFLYLVLQKDRANLALARYKLKALGTELKV
ncbi:hypothetical protein [Deinococcus misasensis]|uniref:hypothetical protein n=1 Tax=Deinococcus misasensis TaxID=392413 RepID=UPI001FDF6EAF|nr:hypothetical protein [Deinococcus misasensis]